MDVWAHWGLALVKGLPALWTHPFTYLLLIIIVLHWNRQMNIQRKLFGTRLHTVTEGLLHSLFYGIVGGFLVSLLLIGFGVIFSAEVFLYLWISALLLSLIRVRYLCFAYAGTALAVLALVARFFPQGSEIEWLSGVWSVLAGIYLPSLFALVALLHVAESVLVYISGDRRATPVFVQGKRGRLVGGYRIQHMWFVPLFLLVKDGQASFSPLFEGWPLFTPEQMLPLSLLLLPAVLGYSEEVVSSTPKQKARFSARWLLLYSILLFFLSLASVYIHELIYVAVLFSCGGHEALVRFSQFKEHKGAPIYVHPPAGLKILTIIPYTPAAQMGLKSGEVILKVNGIPVYKRKEVYEALSTNKTFCKLEVQDIHGEQKFLNRALYEHEHHQLGIILAPDEGVPHYLATQKETLWHLLSQRVRRKPTPSAFVVSNVRQEDKDSEGTGSEEKAEDM